MIEKTYTKPDPLDVGLLKSEINAAMIADVDNIHDESANIRIVMDVSFTAAQETILDTTVSDHPALSSYKAKHLAIMDQGIQIFIYSKYDGETQKSLTALHSIALTNRKAHIKDYIDWLDDLLTRFYSKKTTINDAADKAAVDAVTWDWEAEFGPTGTQTVDPLITIENTLDISD